MSPYFSKQPFVFLIFPVIAGHLIGKFLLSFDIAFWCSSTFFVLFLLNIIFIKKKILSNIFLLLAFTFLISVRWNAVYLYDSNHIALQNFEKINSVTGIVKESKFKKNQRNRYTIFVNQAELEQKKINTTGKIFLTTIDVKQRFAFGDLIKINCKLQEPIGQRNPGQFDYKKFLADDDIFLACYVNHIDSLEIIRRQTGNIFMQNIIEPVRSYLHGTIDSYLSQESNPILKALLLGEKQDLDGNMIEQFKNVGVVHVLAISGLHVGFIILFVMVILSLFRLKYDHQIYALLVVLFIFVVLINFKAPVIRASLMAGLYLISKLIERKISLYNIIYFAAFVLLIIDPRDLFNAGFQFSFTAVLSIVYGYKKLKNYFPLESRINFKKYRLFKKFFVVFIWDALLVSFAAVLGTLPLTIYYYGVIPTYALFANVIIIPLIGLVVMAGLLLLIISLFSSLLAVILGNFIDLIFDIIKWIINVFYNLPFSYFHVLMPSIFTILLMMLLVYLLFNLASGRHQILALGTVFLIMVLNINYKNSSNELEVTFLDVGQGDASFIKFPNGKTMLIDGGDATKDWDQGKNTILPFLKQNDVSSINYIVASHPHNDHIGGLLQLLKSFSTDTLVINAYKYNSKKYYEMISICETKKIPIRYVSKGDKLYPDSSCRTYIFHPSLDFTKEHDYSGEECNNSSIVMKIQYGENGILFTGDAEKGAENAFTKYGDFLESEIIKTGHHGSKTSSSQNMLNCVRPLVAVISVAERNKFKHPSPFTLRKLTNNNTKQFLTSTAGALQFKIGLDKIFFVDWNKNSVKLF